MDDDPVKCQFCEAATIEVLPIGWPICAGCRSKLSEEFLLEGVIRSDSIIVIAERTAEEFASRRGRLIRMARMIIDGIQRVSGEQVTVGDDERIQADLDARLPDSIPGDHD